MKENPIEAPDNSQDIESVKQEYYKQGFNDGREVGRNEAPAQAVALSGEQERERFEAIYGKEPDGLSSDEAMTKHAMWCMARDAWQARAALSAPTSMSAEAVEIVKRIKDAAQHWGGWSGTAGQCDRLLELFAAPASMSAAPPAQSTPDGWKVVPVEPTPIMRKAAADAWLNCDSKMVLNKAAAAARAAISAAPSPEKQS